MDRNGKSFIIASVTAMPLMLAWCGYAAALTDLELLGKNIFYDEKGLSPTLRRHEI